MSILDQARLDLEQISGNLNDFGVSITITPIDTEIDPVTVPGFNTKHYTGFNLDGVRVSTKTASVAISENQFVNIGFVIRNANNEVEMKNFLVSVFDSTGFTRNYIVRESYPDESLGLIVLILGDYE